MQTQTLNNLYSSALISLAHSYARENVLARPDVAAQMQSKLCGSVVSAQLQIEAGRVVAHCIVAEADALGRASTAIVQQGIDGASLDDVAVLIAAARAAVLHDQPVATPSRWSQAELLRAIHPFPQRHPSTLLVFDVLEKCLAQYEAGHAA